MRNKYFSRRQKIEQSRNKNAPKRDEQAQRMWTSRSYPRITDVIFMGNASILFWVFLASVSVVFFSISILVVAAESEMYKSLAR